MTIFFKKITSIALALSISAINNTNLQSTQGQFTHNATHEPFNSSKTTIEDKHIIFTQRLWDIIKQFIANYNPTLSVPYKHPNVNPHEWAQKVLTPEQYEILRKEIINLLQQIFTAEEVTRYAIPISPEETP